MIDSHCHLDIEPLYKNLREVLKRAEDNGVKYFLTISTDLKSYELIKKITARYKNIFGTIGIHPHEAKKHINIDKKNILHLKNKNPKIIGVGETGLDYFYLNSDKIIQKKIFVEHIEAAIELDLPIIIHSREAENDTFNILKDFSSKNLKILMHCFTGSSEFAFKLLTLNSYFSASGIITFKNSTDLQNTFKLIPNDKLLIETDSPYLSPVPLRGKKNEPSFIKYTLEKLASIKDVDAKNIEKITNDNFNSLFDLN